MTDVELANALAAILATGRRTVVASTGGGATATAWLAATPGASACLLDAQIPYSPAALERWLGQAVSSACSELTARHMALAAWQRAVELTGGPRRGLVGVGTTASLVSNRPKRGPHRVHAAWHTEAATGVLSLELTKGQRDRAGEEDIASRVTLMALAEAVDVMPPMVPVASGESVQRQVQFALAEWSEVLVGERGWSLSSPDEVPPRVLLSGSFRPLHDGHRGMHRWAGDKLGQSVAYELSLTNVDKPPLDFIELAERLAQFGDERVVITAAPTFAQKARVLPGTTFAIGADTALRLADPYYYVGGVEGRRRAMAEIHDQGCRFLVFGRVGESGFQALDALGLPPEVTSLCTAVPQQEFRCDVSSTQLREQA